MARHREPVAQDQPGFGSAHQMRTHFTRINHVTPHVYQRTFRSHAAA
jgi:transcriptional regulator GlxA family with amidase domain